MIYTRIGKPRGGKTYDTVRDFIRVLTETDQYIVTNIVAFIDKLHAYVAKHFPHLKIDVAKRIRLIDHKQARRFWLYRLDADGRYVDLQDVTRDQERRGENVDYSVITEPNRKAIEQGLPRVYPGIYYAIDEAHVLFDARAWAEMGLSLTFYNSQHGKLDDDVTFVTQFLELVDKRVKDFSQEYIYVVNNAATNFLTFFRGPAYFTTEHYSQPRRTFGSFANETHRFTLNPELASCYDTSAGVGIRGVGKPETKRKKGIHLAWLSIPLLLVILAINYLPELAVKKLIGSVSFASTNASSRVAGSAGAPASASSAFGGSAPAAAAAPVVEPVSESLPPQNPLYVTGYVMRGLRVNVQLSDGRWLTENDPELTKIDRNSVTWNGRRLWIMARRAVEKTEESTVTDSALLQASAPLTALPSTAQNHVDQANVEKWDASTGALGAPSSRIGR